MTTSFTPTLSYSGVCVGQSTLVLVDIYPVSI